ncbi:YdeI family protein [Cohnella faecalis]|uniref:YdeI/OmpD-associated family protein n=1 Tax=Cohnella faecalis TaxID=2315694 RepID=A0A398CNS0_9BACL|nr:YdeI/OmpD-associated family protein [Cohnella faecalis]RIE00554.1 hypothetical protein D3H35_27840 [Cohnella faecalis]
MDEALVKKLKLPHGGHIAIVQPPEGYLASLGLSPEETRLDVARVGEYDFVQLFAYGSGDVERLGPAAARAVKPGGLLWVCYPKGTSAIKADINRDRGWGPLAEAGFEGVALVSLDETWSSMRFRPASGKPRVTPAERKAAVAGEPSASEGVLDTPEDLLAELIKHPEQAALFEKLAPSHKKEYVRWIVEAKKAETRASRIGKAIEKLSQGLKRPSDKI